VHRKIGHPNSTVAHRAGAKRAETSANGGVDTFAGTFSTFSIALRVVKKPESPVPARSTRRGRLGRPFFGSTMVQEQPRCFLRSGCPHPCPSPRGRGELGFLPLGERPGCGHCGLEGESPPAAGDGRLRRNTAVLVCLATWRRQSFVGSSGRNGLQRLHSPTVGQDA
jgi:hypothetical protein